MIILCSTSLKVVEEIDFCTIIMGIAAECMFTHKQFRRKYMYERDEQTGWKEITGDQMREVLQGQP